MMLYLISSFRHMHPTITIVLEYQTDVTTDIDFLTYLMINMDLMFSLTFPRLTDIV